MIQIFPTSQRQKAKNTQNTSKEYDIDYCATNRHQQNAKKLKYPLHPELGSHHPAAPRVRRIHKRPSSVLSSGQWTPPWHMHDAIIADELVMVMGITPGTERLIR
jgi:hypothetical protein